MSQAYLKKKLEEQSQYLSASLDLTEYGRNKLHWTVADLHFIYQGNPDDLNAVRHDLQELKASLAATIQVQAKLARDIQKLLNKL